MPVKNSIMLKERVKGGRTRGCAAVTQERAGWDEDGFCSSIRLRCNYKAREAANTIKEVPLGARNLAWEQFKFFRGWLRGRVNERGREVVANDQNAPCKFAIVLVHWGRRRRRKNAGAIAHEYWT